MNATITHDEENSTKKLSVRIIEKKEFIKKLELHQTWSHELIKQSADEKTVIAQMTRQLLIANTIDFDKKLAGQIKELVQMEQYYNGEYKINMEKLSRDCNLNMKHLIAKAETAIRRDPNSTHCQNLKAVLLKYDLEKDSIDQKDKNHIYISINNLLKFTKK